MTHNSGLIPFSNKDIGWKKWQNPFESDDVVDTEHDDENYEYIPEDSLSNDDGQQTAQKFVLSGMGMVPLASHSTPDKLFNFWMAHTKFDITHEIQQIVEKTRGVECLDIFTRYRMRIGIGKLFRTSDVIGDINESILKVINGKQPNTEAQSNN